MKSEVLHSESQAANPKTPAGVLSALFLLFLFSVSHFPVSAQGLPFAAPQSVGVSAARLQLIDGEVQQAINEKRLPGAVVIVGHKGKIVYRKAFGNRSVAPATEKMTIDTIFDVASLTKPIATATSIMILVEQGKLRLNDTVGRFIPEIEDENAKKVTVQQLLTHVSGYRPDFDLREKWTGREGMLAALKKEKLRAAPGTRFVYSDIGFIVLGEILERVTNKNLSAFYCESVAQKIFADSGFLTIGRSSSNAGLDCESPVRENFGRIAPTENVKGQNSYLGSQFDGDEKTGNQILRGQVHDPTAFRMGGIAGHAGLFSTGDDLARYCQMILNGGILDGKRILSAPAVARMTAPFVVSETGATRGLGWDMNTAFSSNRGEFFALGSFGHTGFTGTSVWIDRVSQTFVVFLSNRVHPDGKGDVTPLRAKVATIAASAIEDAPVETLRLAENIYSSQVAAQIPAFKEQVAAAAATWRAAVSENNNSGSGQTSGDVAVLNGIDVLEKEKFKSLAGMRIGLVTNHTGRNRAGKSTIDVLKDAANVKLVALFAPEHGIRGELDEEGIKDSRDEKTGLPIFSLYGETRRPKPEQLKNLDALVYDIQDIGTRFWTYSTTLKNVLEEAARAKIPVFVLDRPNPIGGVEVEGALADEDKLSFVAAHTIPVRHAMTIGEYAAMMNAERRIGADLRVVEMENWRRRMWFDETNQTWINPSPNMRSVTQAALYPGIGLMEFTNISVGRGTNSPFEVIGAPWMDGQRLAAYLNARQIPGVRFVPVRFTPNASVFKGEECGGVNIIVTNREAFRSVATGTEIAAALRVLFPDGWKIDNYAKLLLNASIFEKLRRGDNPADVQKSWQPPLEEFKNRRARFLLYN